MKSEKVRRIFAYIIVKIGKGANYAAEAEKAPDFADVGEKWRAEAQKKPIVERATDCAEEIQVTIIL